MSNRGNVFQKLFYRQFRICPLFIVIVTGWCGNTGLYSNVISACILSSSGISGTHEKIYVKLSSLDGKSQYPRGPSYIFVSESFMVTKIFQLGSLYEGHLKVLDVHTSISSARNSLFMLC